jgi:hypothetical protein
VAGFVDFFMWVSVEKNIVDSKLVWVDSDELSQD